MSGVITQAIYMGVGSAGAMTDVSTYVDLIAGINYSYGRDSEFDDAAPGTFSFTLDNPDGRFTPENSGSPYATTVTEGMQVCWQAGARLVAGSVIGIEPAFPGDDAAWAQVVITCDDMLGDAARFKVFQSMAYSAAVENSTFFFPLDDPEGTIAGYGFGVDSDGFPYTMQSTGGVAVTYGVEGVAGLCDAQVEVVAAAGASGEYGSTAFTGQAVAVGLLEGVGTEFTAGVWVTPMNDTSFVQFKAESDNRWRLTNTAFQHYDENTTSWVTVAAATVGETYYVELRDGSDGHTMYIDGAEVSNFARVGGIVLAYVNFVVGDAAYGDTQVRLSQISVAPARLGLEHSALTTEAGRLTLLGSVTSTVTLATLPDLSEAPVTPLGDSSGASVLDLINDVIRAEQGHVYTATSGTVSAPVQTVVIRERDRPVTVTGSFDAEDEASGAPSIIRDVTNLAAAVTVSNDTRYVRVSDTDLQTRTTATASEETVLHNDLDMRAWGEDRLVRGSNTRLRVQTVRIDAFTTPTDRSADLLALVPGDRIQLTDLPDTVLGFDTWDGWLLGAEESHRLGVHEFTLKLQPVLDDFPVYDTDRFMSDGEVTLNAGIDAAVTSVVYATSGSEMESSGVPYDIIVDSEEMTVTACNQGTNTLTVTRGVNGTTAAAHSAAAAIELASETLYAF